jgi:hypothetical protein
MNGTAALTLLRARSQKNNYPQTVTGTYLAATGGQRQHYSVLSLYGFSMGYTSIISRSTPKPSGVAAEEATEAKAAASVSHVLLLLPLIHRRNRLPSTTARIHRTMSLATTCLL